MPSSSALKVKRASSPMSDFELKDLGGGRFELSGEMSFDTVDRILRASEGQFNRHDNLEVDFSRVHDADSAGLALLLEWKSRAHQRSAQIHFTALPQSMLAIAQTTEVQHLL